MGIVDRLNAHILGRIRRDMPRVVVGHDAVRIVGPDGNERRLALRDLTQATVIHRDVYSAEAILIELVFADGDRVEMFMDDPQWPALVDALDRSGRIATPSATWQLQAIADGDGAPPRRLL